MQEIWKNVAGYEGLYQVSNLGNVKSLSYRHTNKPKILKKIKMSIGYECVFLAKDKVKKMFYIHRLVANAFIKNINNLPTINHIDGVKTNNILSNLEWMSFTDNNKHAYLNGLIIQKKGEEHHKSKLKNLDVMFIFNSKLSLRVLAKKYNVSKTSIHDIKNGKNWSHLTNKTRIITL
jgi:uncharacterized protein YehS (DUF1456 family)